MQEIDQQNQPVKEKNILSDIAKAVLATILISGAGVVGALGGGALTMPFLAFGFDDLVNSDDPFSGAGIPFAFGAAVLGGYALGNGLGSYGISDYYERSRGKSVNKGAYVAGSLLSDGVINPYTIEIFK